MYCTQCGTQSPVNAKYCPNCGTVIAGAALSQGQPDLGGEASNPNGHYFSTSTAKLIVMSICTLGLYEFYWFYKNWVLIKSRTGKGIMPFWRAFFAPLWSYSCFTRINESAQECKIPDSLSAGLLAIAYFILQALWRLPDPFWLISILSFAPIIPANTLALKLNQALVPGFRNNENFSGWNWFGIIVGGIVFLLATVGTFLPPDEGAY